MTPQVHANAPSNPCPQCGAERVASDEPRCTRCGADLPPVYTTSVDTTPYARAGLRDGAARREMRRWVYTAGPDRLRHLALIRASAASRAFATRQAMLLVAAFALYELVGAGWHRVVRTPDNASFLATAPSGRGWLQVAAAAGAPDEYGCVAVWWSPARCAAAAVPVVLAGFVLVGGVRVVLGFGAGRLLGQPFRSEGRLRAAVHYSMAWSQPLALAAAAVVLAPVFDTLDVVGFPLTPTTSVVFALQGVLACVAGLMWWFWLLRLAHTLPDAVRSRMTVYYGVIAPGIVAGLWIGWRRGAESMYGILWPLLDLRW